jgi:erythromycin esterase-like protein
LDKNLHIAFGETDNAESLLNAIKYEFSQFKNQVLNSTQTSEANHYYNFQSALKNIEQAIDYYYLYHTNQYKSSSFRDSCMFENIRLIEETDKKPILIFGANYHLSKLEGACGWFLNQHYAENYYVIAQQFVAGSVLTVDFSEGTRKIVTKDMKAWKKGLPWKLHQAGLDKNTTIIDLKEQKNNKLKRLFSHKVYFLDFGGLLNSKMKKNYISLIPEEVYDGIYYHYQAESSVYLK